MLIGYFLFFPVKVFANPDYSGGIIGCYKCVIDNYSGQYDKVCNEDASTGKICDFDTSGGFDNPTDSAAEMHGDIAQFKQAGPNQPDAGACNQFLDKTNNNFEIKAITSQEQAVTKAQVYNDLKRVGVITGNFCTDDWLSKGQADAHQKAEEGMDCATCQANCGQPGHKACSDCGNIPGCSAPNKLQLDNFGCFKTIPGGFGDTGSSDCNKDPLDVNSYIGDVIKFGSTVFIGLATLKIIFGGVMYATAAGNAQRISDAKSHILYALLGVALLAGANIILMIFGASPFTVP